MENEKAKSINKRNGTLLTLLLAIPILLGVILYATYCSITPNYVWIYDNVVVTKASQEDAKYYSIANNAIETNLKVDDEKYYSTDSNSKELFRVDLANLNNRNNKYAKLILNFSCEAMINSNNATFVSKPKIDFLLDGNVINTLTLKSESLTSYSVNEIDFKNSKELVVNIKTLGISENSSNPSLKFKDVKIKVLGE